ncbi:MAG TPA: RNA polymerase sigma factor [Gemmatimonadales bacterium]|nr:RNA polymerase sigma factor [Gemmatimonadales bacterium]
MTALSLAAMSGPAQTESSRPLSLEQARIGAAQAGDANAFRAVYEAHVGRVRALCLRLSGDAARADELTQDVFVRVWERLGTFRGESAFSTWLHRLAVNEVLQTLRSAGRRERRVAIMADPPETPIHGGAGPEQSMDLEQAIAALPEGCRTVFVLHDVEGMRHDEIASLTGTAVGTSKAHLFRARRLLREALDR